MPFSHTLIYLCSIYDINVQFGYPLYITWHSVIHWSTSDQYMSFSHTQVYLCWVYDINVRIGYSLFITWHSDIHWSSSVQYMIFLQKWSYYDRKRLKIQYYSRSSWQQNDFHSLHITDMYIYIKTSIMKTS